MIMTDALLADICAHVNSSPKREVCGLVITYRRKKEYIPCRNIAQHDEHFIIDPQDYADAEDKGKVLAVVHSHVGINPAPSQADLIGIERSGVPWIIVNHPLNTWTETEPSGYVAPYEGREFVHGITDCYAIWRDYYSRELGIEMLNYDRSPEWWLKGQDLYADNYIDAGFVEVQELEPHDILLMQVASPVMNHCAVYLGDGIILHHVHGKLSCKNTYGGYWKKVTRKILRHKSRLA